MAMKECKECAAEVSSKAESCPKCGARLKAKPMGCGSLLAVIILGIIVLGAFGSLFDGGDSVGVSKSSPASADGEMAGGEKSTSPKKVASKKPNDGDEDSTPRTNQAPHSTWNVRPLKAEMDGHKIWNASSDEETAYGQLSWPYSEVTAHITVGNDRGDKFVVLVFSQSPNLVGGQTQNGYSIYKLPISFDGKTKSLTITQKWGHRIFIPNTQVGLFKKWNRQRQSKSVCRGINRPRCTSNSTFQASKMLLRNLNRPRVKRQY